MSLKENLRKLGYSRSLATLPENFHKKIKIFVFSFKRFSTSNVLTSGLTTVC